MKMGSLVQQQDRLISIIYSTVPIMTDTRQWARSMEEKPVGQILPEKGQDFREYKGLQKASIS